MEEDEACIKELGSKELLNKQWETVINTWEYINKRLQDIWHHPTGDEITWFHKVWGDLSNDVSKYFELENQFLTSSEQPKVEDAPALVEVMNTEEVGLIQESDGTWNVKKCDCLRVKASIYPDDALIAKPNPTIILSKAIEQVKHMGDYKVMIALVDLDNSKPKEERLHTFCDIEGKKLREVIYKKMEKEI